MSTAPTQPAAATTGERGAFTPIGEYGLLADCNSAALVGRDGSIDDSRSGIRFVVPRARRNGN